MDIIEYRDNLVKKSEIFAEVMSVCGTILKHNKIAEETREYLQKRIPVQIPGFSFGYFPDNDNLKYLYEYMDKSKLQQCGLIYNNFILDGGFHQEKTYSILSDHNLVMPYKNLYGDFIGIVGRTLLNNYKELKLSKYKNSPLRKGLNLYGLYNAKKEIIRQKSVIIVEGQFDCITCHRFGIRNVVALGCAFLSKYQLFLLLRYTNNIFLLLDNDEAGKKSIERAHKLNESYGNLANMKSLILPDGFKDIDDFLVKDCNGAGNWLNEIQSI